MHCYVLEPVCCMGATLQDMGHEGARRAGKVRDDDDQVFPREKDTTANEKTCGSK